MSEITQAEKDVFLAATNRRKAAGIRLKRISFMATEHQVEGFNNLFDSWIERFGKNKAVDVLLKLMSEVEARMREQGK